MRREATGAPLAVEDDSTSDITAPRPGVGKKGEDRAAPIRGSGVFAATFRGFSGWRDDEAEWYER